MLSPFFTELLLNTTTRLLYSKEYQDTFRSNGTYISTDSDSLLLLFNEDTINLTFTLQGFISELDSLFNNLGNNDIRSNKNKTDKIRINNLLLNNSHRHINSTTGKWEELLSKYQIYDNISHQIELDNIHDITTFCVYSKNHNHNQK